MITVPESYRDLIEAPWTASMSTVDADGMPQVTAVWYLADDDKVKTSLMTSGRSTRISSLTPRPPYSSSIRRTHSAHWRFGL